MNKDSKIFIAGHRGLVGSAIKRSLESQGYTNIVVRTRDELDLTDQQATETFFASEKPEYVFLAAAKVGGINANNIYRADFIYENLEVQNNVISASYRHKVTKLLFLGSVCIYPKFAEVPVREDSLLSGELEYTNEPYAIAKIAGMKMIESFNLQYGTNYLSVMPANLYGPNDNFDLEKSHVLPALIRRTILCKMLEDGDFNAIAKDFGIEFTSEEQITTLLAKYGIVKNNDKVAIQVWGTGNARRELMHSDDMAEACIYVMNNVEFSDVSKDMKEVKNTHINLGTGTDISIKDLAYSIKEAVGFEGEIEFDTSKPDGTAQRTMSVEKVNKLGWKHKIDLENGVHEMIQWYKENK